MPQGAVSLIGATGDWGAEDNWTVALRSRNASMQPVATLATATFASAGPDVVHLSIPEPRQTVDPSSTPYLTLDLTPVGRPPAVLAAAGGVNLTVTGEPSGSAATSLPPLVPGPYDRSSLALAIPLPAGRQYELADATVTLIGATGTWDAGNCWRAALQRRADGLDPVSTRGSAWFGTGGAGVLSLPVAGRTVRADETPVLTLGLTKYGDAPSLLSAACEVELRAWREEQATTDTYDAAGNTLSEVGPDGVFAYAWDPDNRLRSATADGAPATYAYDATGLRRRAEDAGGAREFVWDGQNLLAELDESQARLAQYTDFPGAWGGLTSRRAGDESEFYGFDLSANARQLLDALGAVDEEMLYEAFGSELLTGSTPYGFGGQVGYDRDTAERLYVRARHYRPGSGSWMSRDPVARRGTEPPYRYSFSNPVSWMDASGLRAGIGRCWDCPLSVFGDALWNRTGYVQFDPTCRFHLGWVYPEVGEWPFVPSPGHWYPTDGFWLDGDLHKIGGQTCVRVFCSASGYQLEICARWVTCLAGLSGVWPISNPAEIGRPGKLPPLIPPPIIGW